MPTQVEVLPKEQVLQEFVAAVNTNDSKLLKEQILKHWSDSLLGKNNRWLSTDLNYWLVAHQEFGPLVKLLLATISLPGLKESSHMIGWAWSLTLQPIIK